GVGRRPRAPTDLAETEERIAELAAQSLSARAIAERAFVATKTASNVLGLVYSKLGISSRAELGARMEERRRDRSGYSTLSSQVPLDGRSAAMDGPADAA